MAGDYTRFTHKPGKRYSSVLMQQGRVQLDSDWNEQSEINKRRWEVQAIDTFGRCAVPKYTTPDAFKITAQTSGASTVLEIGAGRLYVDGLLAESFDVEQNTYTHQPFFPNPPAVNLPVGFKGFVYLDVWEREITYIEDLELLEKAMGGPDTTTRKQPVWQVKVQETPGVPTCKQDLSAVCPVSGGRLTTRAESVPDSEDPCLISPTGGFRGLENRLYRVEVHVGGDLSEVRFKWSRDNASVVAAIESIQSATGQSTLVVSSIGRDNVQKFSIGDWVEVKDDHAEFAGRPGDMAKIVDVRSETRTIILDRQLVGPFGATESQIKDRHTRLIRWDQKENISLDNNNRETGLLAVTSPNDFITLEDGVQVNLTVAPGEFLTSDYWVFAARTADSSVEELVAEPPRGIIHHCCQLATISVSSTTPIIDQDASTERQGVTIIPGAGKIILIKDCRPLWPEDAGCCTILVRPGDSIQAAIDSLPDEGGCVCLKNGTHIIENIILLQKSNVVIHGESPAVRVVQRGQTIADVVLISPPSSAPFGSFIHDILIEGIRFESDSGAHSVGLIRIFRGEDITVRNCVVRKNSLPSAAFFITNSNRISLEANSMENLIRGVTVFDSKFINLIENTVIGGTMLSGGKIVPVGDVGFSITRTSGKCRIEDNQINNFPIGIEIDKVAEFSVIARNEIPLVTLESRTQLNFGIAVAAADCIISENHVELSSRFHAGIRATGSRTRVVGNQITSRIPVVGEPSRGIVIQTPTVGPPLTNSVVQGNSINGTAVGILVSGSTLDTGVSMLGNISGVQVLENDIEGVQGDIPTIGILTETAQDMLVADNHIKFTGTNGITLLNGVGNSLIDNHVSEGVVGIGIFNETKLRVSGNVIENMRGPGIIMTSSEDIKCDHNRLAWCGFGLILEDSLPSFADGSGMSFQIIEGYLYIESCEILSTGRSRKKQLFPLGATHGIKAAFVNDCHISGNRIAIDPLDMTLDTSPGPILNEVNISAVLPAALPNNLDENDEHRAISLLPFSVFNSYVEILDNVMLGIGNSHLIDIGQFKGPRISFRKIIFSNNRCEHARTRTLDRAFEDNLPLHEPFGTVALTGKEISVVGNQVRATHFIPSAGLVPVTNISFPSFNFHAPLSANGPPGVLTALGNVNSGQMWTQISGFNQVPFPAVNFNHIRIN